MKIKQEIDRILTEYNLERMSFDEAHNKLFDLYVVSHRREMLLAYEEFTSYKVLGKKTPRISKQMVEDYLANNSG